MTALLLATCLGLGVGLVIGGLGGGGGVLTVPALVYALGLTAQDATTASVVIVGTSALVGVLARLGPGVETRIDLRRGLLLGLAGLPAAWLGTVLNHRADQAVLLVAFAAVTIVAAVAVLVDARHRRRAEQAAGLAAPAPGAPATGGPATGGPATGGPAPGGPATGGTALAAPAHPLAVAARVAGCGVAVGFLTGFLGVGGGFLAVPALVVVLRMPMRLAVGTSLLVIVLNSATAMASRLDGLALDWRVVAPFTVAAVVATLLGKRVADRLSGATLSTVFAVVLVGVGLFVGVEALLGA